MIIRMILSQEEVIDRLRKAVERAGTMRAWARANGVSDVYVGMVLRRQAQPGFGILRALRIKKLPPQYEDRTA